MIIREEEKEKVQVIHRRLNGTEWSVVEEKRRNEVNMK